MKKAESYPEYFAFSFYLCVSKRNEMEGRGGGGGRRIAEKKRLLWIAHFLCLILRAGGGHVDGSSFCVVGILWCGWGGGRRMNVGIGKEEEAGFSSGMLRHHGGAGGL